MSRPTMLKILSTLALSGLAFSASATGDAPADSCPSSYYRMADGSGIDIGPADDGHHRWRRLDGTSGLLSQRADGAWTSTLGWTGRADGTVVDLADCGRGAIRVAGVSGERVAFATTNMHFANDGAELAGRLVLPTGPGPFPIVVLVHGSESASALNRYALQRLLPAQGVGVFVYDKRGTGESTGAFTHDFRRLASDAAAAVAAARAAAGGQAGRIGFYGTSQGGWTAPLAATMAKVDFVIVGYGLAVSPADEDSEALALDMTRHGFGAGEVAKALEIGTAAQAVARRNFQSGYDGLARVVATYRQEPWFRYVRGNITGVIVSTPEAVLRVEGPKLLPGIDPDYDPMPALKALRTPQLWILGGEDLDAPYLETFRRLSALRKEGRAISIVVYPHVEHELLAFETKGEERLSTAQPPSLQRLLTAFARGAPLDPAYDDADVRR